MRSLPIRTLTLAAARLETLEGRTTLGLLDRACVLLDAGKIACEAVTGASIFTDPAALGGDPAPLAHLLGAPAGWICVLPSRRRATAKHGPPAAEGRSEWAGSPR